MKYTVRLIGSLIKFLIYICVILIAAGAALFWFDTGSWLVLPLAQRAGNFFLAPLKLELADVNGSLRNGYTLDGLKLISKDTELFTLDHAAVSPDWELAMKLLDGIPYIKNLELQGISSDLDKVMALVNHFTSPEEKTEPEKESSFTLKLNPFNASIKDLYFGTDYANISLDAITLNDSGDVKLNVKVLSQDNILPLKANAKFNFDQIEIISSDLFIGQKSTGSFSGMFSPIKARLDLTALSLDELMKFAPPTDIKASGRLDSRIFLDTDSDDIMNISGVISMPRANIMDIPLNFRLPFKYNMKNIAALENASLNTEIAKIMLNASADISSMKIKANGTANNISLSEIGRMFAPEAKLKGTGGWLNFDIDTTASGDLQDILAALKADFNAAIPILEASGIRIIRDMNAHFKLTPGETPKISLGGQAFGGKLFARAEAQQDDNGEILPHAIVSIVNLDLNSIAQAFPAVKSVKPSGRLTATARISEKLNVIGKITSDRLSASGVTLNNLQANLNYNNVKGNAAGIITSGKLSSNGVTLSNLLANVSYDMKSTNAELSAFRANLGKGQITASGSANINDGIFNARAEAKDIDPRAIPGMNDISGQYRFAATAAGKYTDVNSINATASLEGRNIAYAGQRIGNVVLPITYTNNKLTIPKAAAVIPGGTIDLWGTADLKNMDNPTLNLTASTSLLNIASALKAYGLEDKSMPVSGTLRGNVSIKGPLKSAAVNANIHADNIKAGDILDMPSGVIEAIGDTRKVVIRKIDARVNDARVMGSGAIEIDQKNFADSKVNVETELRRMDLKKLLNRLKVDLPLSGIIDAYAVMKGKLSGFALDARVSTIEYNNEINFDDIKLTVRSPGKNHFLINTSAKVDTFRPEIDIDVKETGKNWAYAVNTRPLDLATVMESKLVNMPDIVKGFATVSVKGDTGKNSPISVTAAANELKVLDKITIQNISLPVIYRTSNNTITMRNATALINNGIITANADSDLKKSKWDGKVEVKHLNFGELADPFMPMGKLVGSVDVNVTMNGGFGVMPLSFANGKFETTPGYLHKIDILDRISNGRISFKKIEGTFFWNGTDLYLNPGTGARADTGEPLYRYFNINGPMGITGKGLGLMCDGRFDLKVLDQLLGAMKGIFQYMTGTIAQSVLRDAAGRVLGVKSRDFQNVSFTLANSWQELQLLDLKITKSIEDFLPINILNQDEEKQKEGAQFKMNLKFPTGPGDKSIEEESPEDQLKQQFIDNLFNIGW